MRSTTPRRCWQDVITFNHVLSSRATVRRYYEKWRKENSLSVRCDIAECHFHTAAMVWNGAPLRPILDHTDGNRYNNHPQNLRYLCPNCDSQLETRGGGNRGRVEMVVAGGYILRNKDGSKIAATTGAAHGGSSAVARAVAVNTKE